MPVRWRKRPVVGVVAAIVLTVTTSVTLGVLAKTTAVAFDVPDTISVLDLVVISTLGGLLSSAVVLALTLALAAAPNPFNPRTRLSFTLDRSGEVALRVFDLRGRRVRTILDGAVAAGVVLDVGGVGYEVAVTPETLAALPALGDFNNRELLDVGDEIVQFQNLDSAAAQGIELQLDARFKTGAWGYASYGYQETVGGGQGFASIRFEGGELVKIARVEPYSGKPSK